MKISTSQHTAARRIAPQNFSKPNGFTKARGFTLIELLVVVAIIAILAAIMFPVFARTRAKAREASSTSNLKQIGLAIQQYCQDYDSRTPIIATMFDLQTSRTNSAVLSDPQSAIVVLEPYVKSRQLFTHPGAVQGIKNGVGQNQSDGELAYRFMGWDAPCRSGGNGVTYSRTEPACTNGMFQPWNTDTVLNGQHMDDMGAIYNGEVAQRTVARETVTPGSPAQHPHTDGILMYLKMDGHIERRKVSSALWKY